MSNPTADDRVTDEVSEMLQRWGSDACDYLDKEDHSEWATGLVIAGLIQMARALMEDNNVGQREKWVRILAADGIEVPGVSKLS